uniref:Uncharacterized protein n=1 Tax=Anguilla anguilla TaxID=7936 RepID=A0A0E9TGN0_ANGAN
MQTRAIICHPRTTCLQQNIISVQLLLGFYPPQYSPTICI